MQKTTEQRERYTVQQNRFHGERIYYHGTSLNQAIKIARRYDCVVCKCGGPYIIRDSDGAGLAAWHVTPPFQPADKPFWCD